jgi:hypothetical protein
LAAIVFVSVGVSDALRIATTGMFLPPFARNQLVSAWSTARFEQLIFGPGGTSGGTFCPEMAQ